MSCGVKVHVCKSCSLVLFIFLLAVVLIELSRCLLSACCSLGVHRVCKTRSACQQASAQRPFLRPVVLQPHSTRPSSRKWATLLPVSFAHTTTTSSTIPLVSCSRALPVSAHTLTSQPQLNRLRMLWAALHTGHMEPDHQPLKSKLVFELVSECVCVCL